MEAKTKPQKNFTSPRHPEKLAPHTSISDNLGRISTQSRISNNLAHESQKHKTSAHKIYAASLLRDTDVVEQRRRRCGRWSLLSARRASLQAAHIAPQRGTLHVTLHSAEGLRAADTSGYSDPYATIGVGFHPSATAGTLVQSTVARQTLNPLWQESFPLRGASTSCAAALCISTYSTMTATRAARTTG